MLLKHLQIRSSSGDIFKAPKIYHLFLEIQLFPCSDTHVLTLEMLTGQQLKNPYMQPVDVSYVQTEIVDM